MQAIAPHRGELLLYTPVSETKHPAGLCTRVHLPPLYLSARFRDVRLQFLHRASPPWFHRHQVRNGFPEPHDDEVDVLRPCLVEDLLHVRPEGTNADHAGLCHKFDEVSVS